MECILSMNVSRCLQSRVLELVGFAAAVVLLELTGIACFLSSLKSCPPWQVISKTRLNTSETVVCSQCIDVSMLLCTAVFLLHIVFCYGCLVCEVSRLSWFLMSDSLSLP